MNEILERLEDSRVLTIKTENNKLVIGENCDGFFNEKLTKNEALKLIKELQDLIKDLN